MNEMTVPRTAEGRTGRLLYHPAPRLVERSERRPVAVAESGASWARAYRHKIHATDLVVLAVSVGIAFLVRFAVDPGSLTQGKALHYCLLAALVLLVWLIDLSTFRTRDSRVIGVGAGEYRRIINASTTTFGVVAILFLLAGAESGRWFFAISFPLGMVALLFSRWLWRKWLIRQRSFGHSLSRVIIVGRRWDVERAIQQITMTSSVAYTVIGAVLDGSDLPLTGAAARGIALRKGLDRVAAHAQELGADGVVVAGQPGEGEDYIHDLAWQLEGKSIDLVLATSLANVAGPRIHFRPVDGLPLLHVEIPQFEGGKHVLKRAMDLVFTIPALIVLTPFFLIMSAVIKLDSPGPAYFSQTRVGQGGHTFNILKFRSMAKDAPERLSALVALNEGSGLLFKMKNDPRITRVGRFIRKYSLDEFPQLWNVVKGEMSLVGPRPPLPSEVDGYQDHVRRRLFIKPGLTGMWQVNGRSALSWEDSVRLDLYYVENWSVVGDLMIMWRTLKVLIHPVGAY